MIRIERDDPRRRDVLELLGGHLADMSATSPAESVHALDPAALSGPAITFWTARQDARVLGCGALKQLQARQGEIKSMHTAAHARGRGIAALLLAHIVDEARRSGHERLFLETGSQEFFAPARRLYHRHGFLDCPPFAGYVLDPNSIFMTLDLAAHEPAGHIPRHLR
ncbi:GNAT family N-acetyltransferase [Arthrobacter sp. UYEF20]|uniref:GNAT family N-acetyltransferase n=1 Tax=Arthrobacter sp. UYEF20 TaxID=1756363 RepID=UPI003394EF28